MGENEGMSGVYGTAYYVSPEVLQGNYNEKCDVWSVGVILYMLLSGCPPFNGKSDIQILDAVKRGQYVIDGGVFNEISNEAKDLIVRMLTLDPDQRISAHDALNHKWISDSIG